MLIINKNELVRLKLTYNLSGGKPIAFAQCYNYKINFISIWALVLIDERYSLSKSIYQIVLLEENGNSLFNSELVPNDWFSYSRMENDERYIKDQWRDIIDNKLPSN